MEEIKDEIKNLNKLERLTKFIKIFKYSDKKYKNILKHDIWWSSKDVKYSY